MPDEEEIEHYKALREVVRRLRAPEGGCPWDLEQTHASLRPFLIQEAFEAVAAIDAGETGKLPEEMGDVLFQVLLHGEIASQAGDWSLSDVYRILTEKLVRRHPHVFGDTHLETAAEVLGQWEELKRGERAAEAAKPAGVLDSLPQAMPALAFAQEALSRAASAGFAWPQRSDVLAKLAEEVEELDGAKSDADRAEEFGDILLNLANYARYINVDAEEALRLATRKFRQRFGAVETSARERNLKLKEASRDELMALWDEAKRA